MIMLPRITALMLVVVLAGWGCGGSSGDAGSGLPAGFDPVAAIAGPATVPDLDRGRPADLSVLSAEEDRLLAEADARAERLRKRRLVVWLGAPGVAIDVVQVRHGFPIGSAIDFAAVPPADVDWYRDTFARHFNLAVFEGAGRWSTLEPVEGRYDDRGAREIIDWAAPLDIRMKLHELGWGLPVPYSLPQWVLERYPSPTLAEAERGALLDLLKGHITETMGSLGDRIDLWDVTNETLNPLANWLVQRLGRDYVYEVFALAHRLQPTDTLVFNELTAAVIDGARSPSPERIRDRVLELRAGGAPIAAVGLQAHFASWLAQIFPDNMTTGPRLPLDRVVAVLDTVAAAGLPIHITELSVVNPTDAEERAAQLEGVLRLLWGAPGRRADHLLGVLGRPALDESVRGGVVGSGEASVTPRRGGAVAAERPLADTRHGNHGRGRYRRARRLPR